MWARLLEGWSSCGLVFTWFMTETASVWRLHGLRTQKIRKLDNWDIYEEPLDRQHFWEVTLKIPSILYYSMLKARFLAKEET
jgi:hypothetical protein